MFDFNTVDQTGDAGMNVDVTDPGTALRAGAVVLGSTVVVASVGVTTVAAPAFTLVPAAVATGLWVYADKMRDDKLDADASKIDADAPAAA